MGQHLDSGYHSGPHQTGLPTDGQPRSNRPVPLQIQTTATNENPPKKPETENPLCQIESTSSVCHSPTWDAVNDKKKRKRAEKEKLAKEKRLEKEKEVLEKRLRKVEEKRRLGDQTYIRDSLDISTDVKPKRPSFTLRRLSIVSVGLEVENEERISKRLSKSRRSSISGDRLQPYLNGRPSLPSRKNGRWSHSFPDFPFRTIPRLRRSRSGKEVVDKGQMTLERDIEMVDGERSTPTGNGYAPNDYPEGGGACAKEATTPSREVSNNKAASSQVVDPHSEPLLIPHSKHQRKLARKAAITTQSPRQLYSQNGSRDQKTHIYAITSPQSDPLKVEADHSCGQPTQLATIPSLLSNNLPSISFPLRQHPPNTKYQDFNRGIESILQRPNNIEPENDLEKIQDSTTLRRERSDKRDAQILEWNEQVTSQDQEAVAQDSMNLHQRRIARRQLKQKGGDGKQIVAIKRETPLKGVEFAQLPELTVKQENSLLINVEQHLKSESAGVVAEKTSDMKSSDKYKDREVLRPIRPNPPTRPWTWNLPFSSLWQAKADAVSGDSNTPTSSSSSEAVIEEPDTVFVSSSQGQRSRCSSTTIKPTISGQAKAELLVEPVVPILKAPHGNCSQTSKDLCEQSNPKGTEDRRHSISSQFVDATLLDLKLHNLGAGLRPGEQERSSSSLRPDTRERNLALTSGPTQATNERRSIENPDWIQISHKSPKKTPALIQGNTTKFTSLAVPRADLPHSKYQSTFKESQEKVSISDGSESISHLSTKSTSLSSFDKCSLPPGASANSYGAHPTSAGRRSLNRGASSKPGQVAKIFIVCCRCCRWHDPPSAYFHEFITRVGRATTIKVPAQPGEGAGESTIANQNHTKNTGKEKCNFACHWCEHQMSRHCCACWTSLCSFHQRHWTRPDSQG